MKTCKLDPKVTRAKKEEKYKNETDLFERARGEEMLKLRFSSFSVRGRNQKGIFLSYSLNCLFITFCIILINFLSCRPFVAVYWPPMWPRRTMNDFH